MFYKTYFKLDSDYTHLSHRVLGRNVKMINNEWVFTVDSVCEADLHFSSFYLIGLSLQLLEILEKLGYPVDSRYHQIGREMKSMSCPKPSWCP